MARRSTALVERLIGALKQDPDYRLEGDYQTADLVEEVLRRGRDAARGLLLMGRARSVEFPVFCGRRVLVRHGRKVHIGRATLLGDDVLLEGLSRGGLRIGRNVTVGRGTTLTCTGVIARPGIGMRIGDRTGIGEYSHFGGQGGLEIGRDVLFGPGVRIFTENHRFDRADVAIRLQGEHRAPVVIEDDCWVGAGATIVAGVRLGRGSVVGAAAVVTGDVPPGAVVVGAPARVVSMRGQDRSADPA